MRRTVQDLLRLSERVRKMTAIPMHVANGMVEIVPTTLREAIRALAIKSQLGDEGTQVALSVGGFNRIEEPDFTSYTVRVGAGANVGDIEASLRGHALTLGWLSPRVRSLSVREWLEGPYAGLRVVPGNRLETAALSIGVALQGGGAFVSFAAPRQSVGPRLDALFLGGGGWAGLLVEAQLRALPRPEACERVHGSVRDPREVVRALRLAVQKDVPLVEARVARRGRGGYDMDMVVAGPSWRIRRDRSALEEIVRAKGELRRVQRVDEADLPLEGELGWDALPGVLSEVQVVAVYRLAREGVIGAAAEHLPGALALDRMPDPLPAPLLAALGRDPPKGDA